MSIVYFQIMRNLINNFNGQLNPFIIFYKAIFIYNVIVLLCTRFMRFYILRVIKLRVEFLRLYLVDNISYDTRNVFKYSVCRYGRRGFVPAPKSVRVSMQRPLVFHNSDKIRPFEFQDRSRVNHDIKFLFERAGHLSFSGRFVSFHLIK